jgi:hypothetical protein
MSVRLVMNVVKVNLSLLLNKAPCHANVSGVEVAPHILNLSTRPTSMVSFMFQVLYSQSESQYPLNKWSESHGKEQNHVLPGIKHQLFSP